jgi:hypothetical protein
LPQFLSLQQLPQLLWALASVTALLVGGAFAVGSAFAVIAALANFIFAAVATTAGTAVATTICATAAIFTAGAEESETECKTGRNAK